MADNEVLRAPHVLEFPYKRSVGPIIGGFLTGLRDGRILGARTPSGKVVVPPTEYDPETSEEVDPELVEVGPGGVVTSWAWTDHPHADQPLGTPFAWALIQLDGADTAMLHALDSGSSDRCSTGMRVTARFRPDGERIGRIQDIECFVPEENS
ncbi:MAG: OB-fold domain-containing protein [Acidimicrobiales bacterium]|jgi:uncharacterized protein